MRLKHFLSVFLTILTLGVGQMWADNASASTPTLQCNTSATTLEESKPITYQFSGSSNTYDPLRWYSNVTLTISASSGYKITDITITASGTYSLSSISVQSGGGSISDGVWSNNAGSTSVVLKNTSSSQTRITGISVTYESTGGSTKCATPSISPEACDFYGSQQVTITTATADAAIYYTTDNTAPSKTNGTLYTTAFAVSDATTTVKAIAVKDGMTDSDVASVEYTYAGPAVTSYDIDFESVAAAYVNWEFNNIGIRSTITPHGGSYYGANVNSGGNGVQTASITTKAKYAAPGLLTFYISKESNNTTASYWKAQVSSNGTDWTDVQQFDAHSSAMNSGAKWNECIADLSAYTNVYVRISYGSSGAIRAIDDISLEAATAVIKPTISGTENFVTSTTVTLACATDGATIYYTTDGSDPKTSATKQTGTSFTLTNTATVRAIANKGSDWSNEATQKTFTKITPMTVAEALVEATGSGKYVEGVITSITEVSIVNGNATYIISDVVAGVPQNEMIVYRGKYIDGAAFTSADQIHEGDRVIVSGSISQYASKNQMAAGNKIESLSDPAVAVPTFTPNGGGFVVSTDVEIECSTASSAIYYTTDGSTNPTKSSTLYNAPIHLDADATIKAIAYVGEESSLVVTKTFTLTDPKTVAEAYDELVSADLENVAVEGIVYDLSISSGNATYWISDDGNAGTKVLEVFKGKGIGGADVAAGDIREGDKVIVFGTLTIYTGGSEDVKEFKQGSHLLSLTRKTVESVAVTGTPTKTNYKVGDAFDPAGLTVTVTYDDASHATVAVADCSWEKNPATFDAAGTGLSVSVKATYDGVQSPAFAVEGITVKAVPTFDDPNYEWQLVTGAGQLKAGKYYVMASASAGKTANKTITSGYLGTVASTIADGVIAYNALGENTAIFELGGESDAWTLVEAIEEKQLTGATTANFVWDGATNTTWPISIDGENAIIGASDGYRVLYNVNSPRFKPYNSATSASMVLPQLYVWALKTYKLRYDANGGEDAPAAQVADGEGKATVTSGIPTAPTDKVFDKWNTQYDGNGTDKAAGDVIDLSTADVTLYAIWRDPETVTISYDANGGEGSIDADVDQVEGTQYTIKANTFTRDGYSFIGWKAYDALDNELTITAKKITVPATNVTIKAQWGEIVVSDFVLVTDVNQLKDGDKVYIAAAGYDRAMGTQNTNYRNEVGIGKESDFLTIMGAAPVEFTLGKDGDKYTFNDGTGYLYAAGTANSSKNYINTKDTYDDACDWTITIDENKTVISSVKNNYTPYMQYNSGSTRFSCYHTESMQAVVLYKAANYIRSINAGRFGTICLPNGGVLLGADLYEVAYYGETSKKIFFDEILSGVMEAGVPYVFLPQEGVNKLAVVYTDDADAAATNRNGLVGFIGADEDDETSVPAGMYILQNNQYREVLAGADARIKSYRAYINLGAITPTAPALAPGRRRISMGVASENSATGMDELNASETPVKMMIDGQLYILRGEKLYDATGRLVK